MKFLYVKLNNFPISGLTVILKLQINRDAALDFDIVIYFELVILDPVFSARAPRPCS